jgi:hypothetical protein
MPNWFTWVAGIAIGLFIVIAWFAFLSIKDTLKEISETLKDWKNKDNK